MFEEVITSQMDVMVSWGQYDGSVLLRIPDHGVHGIYLEMLWILAFLEQVGCKGILISAIVLCS